MARAVTGEQFTLHSGSVQAQVSAVAAALRGLAVDGVDVVAGYGPDQTPPSASGITLAPWPNRTAGGVWVDADGVRQQLDISEPARNNAIHGLVRFTAFSGVQPSPDRVILSTTIHPQHGYPYLVDLDVEYRLTESGIVVEYRVHNAGSVAAPVALGAHPFVTIGDVAAESLTVRINCNTHLTLDQDSMVPVGRSTLDGGEHDLRQGRLLGELDADDAYADPTVQDGHITHTVSAPDGRTLAVWGDSNFEYWQVFTSRSYPGQSVALAIEPMTAPGNALVSGEGLRWLEPGERWSLSWGMTLSQA
ncbi:MAG: aldose 1-epimerase family protein [Mycetocola sp.]